MSTRQQEQTQRLLPTMSLKPAHKGRKNKPKTNREGKI